MKQATEYDSSVRRISEKCRQTKTSNRIVATIRSSPPKPAQPCRTRLMWPSRRRPKRRCRLYYANSLFSLSRAVRSSSASTSIAKRTSSVSLMPQWCRDLKKTIILYANKIRELTSIFSYNTDPVGKHFANDTEMLKFAIKTL